MKSLPSKIIIVSLTLIQFCYLKGQEHPLNSKAEVNLIHGSSHIFTVETPNGWINDKELAKQFGLICFFYPLLDSTSDFTIYMYAIGFDKLGPDDNLEGYIRSDLGKFSVKHPNMKYDTFEIAKAGGIINAKYYSFYNLSDRFKEEVLYSETDSAFIILSFTAKEKSNFEEYFSDFEKLINSFKYLGNDPASYLNLLEE
jgi:hypothetical protein